MATKNAHQAKSPKQELLELLEREPEIHKDAVKWTLACWTGIKLSSLFKEKDSVKADRAIFLKQLQELQESGFIRLENPEGASEVTVHLTEQGRDEIIDLFYSKEEKEELKRLFKRFDSVKPSP